jgi:hypothetical protein
MTKRTSTRTATAPVALQTPLARREAAELWTDKEACQFLSAEPRTLRLWRHTRGLPFIRITSKVLRYRRNDLEAWLDARRVALSPE